MATDLYTISNSAAVSESFRAAMESARQDGIFPAALRAARWIVEELQRTPHQLGESRDYFPQTELAMRIAFVQPFVVIFAVHEPSKTVFIRSIGRTS